MKIVTRYLAREVYAAMLATIVVLLFIFLSNQFVRFMHVAAVGGVPGGAVKLLLLLQLPILSAVLLPVSLFLGILLAYGRLYADSEMTVFIACGINPGRLLAITLRFSVAVMLFVAFLSLWFNPKVYKYSDHIVSGGVSSSLELIKPNSFNSISNGRWVFYVEAVSPNKKRFYNIFAAKQPELHNGSFDKSALCVVTAKSAYQKVDKNTGDLYMILVDGYRYIGTPGQKDYEVIKYNEYGVQIQQDVNVWHKDSSSMSTAKLWSDRQNLLSMAELQWRISLPLSALILTLIGMPLSKIKPRYGRYARLAPAVLLYIIYVNLLFLAKAWIKRGVLSPVLGMWWVHGLMLILAGVLIGHQVGWRHVWESVVSLLLRFTKCKNR